jgi:hypothetical protein
LTVLKEIAEPKLLALDEKWIEWLKDGIRTHGKYVTTKYYKTSFLAHLDGENSMFRTTWPSAYLSQDWKLSLAESNSRN